MKKTIIVFLMATMMVMSACSTEEKIENEEQKVTAQQEEETKEEPEVVAQQEEQTKEEPEADAQQEEETKEEPEVVAQQEEQTKEEESGMNKRLLVSVEFIEQDGEYVVCKDKDGITYRVKTENDRNMVEGERLKLEYDTAEVEELEENVLVINDGVLSPGKPLKSMK